MRCHMVGFVDVKIGDGGFQLNGSGLRDRSSGYMALDADIINVCQVADLLASDRPPQLVISG